MAGSGSQKRTGPDRLVIVDDHDLIRSGLKSMLAGVPDLAVVGEARDGREALEVCRRLRPDLVLMDVRMPRMDGLAATRALKEECPEISVIMVTMYDDEDYLLEAIRAGAAGYVLKGATHERLTTAIREALDGEFPLNRGLATGLLLRLARGNGERKKPAGTKKRLTLDTLTPRETEILKYLARGKSNREIAEALVISAGTVKTHIQRLTPKLGVSDRTQAAVRAVEAGLLDEPDEVIR
jgi:DNA-binding NarL/FixJ family response regulator